MWPFIDSRYQRIVAVEHDPSHDRFILYQRGDDGTRIALNVPARYYLLVDDRGVLPTRSHGVIELEGPHPLRYLLVSDRFAEYNDLAKRIRQDLHARHPQDGGKRLWQRSPVDAFMIFNQITLFSGLTPLDLKVAALDLEVYTAGAKLFADAHDPLDKIILATVSDNRGKSQVFDARTLGEDGLILALCQLIQEEDYDVLTGHNICGFDLPYLVTRAMLLGLPLNLGRDGAPPRAHEARRAMRGSNEVDYSIYGRHVLDTLPMLLQWDISNRSLQNYRLKDAVFALGLSADRRDFQRENISALWDAGDESLLEYAAADARDSLALYTFLEPPYFYQAQVLPLSLQQCVHVGTGSKVDLALVTAYLARNHSLPWRAADAALGSGGLTDVRSLGWHRVVHKADVASLYPSICLSGNLHPGTDCLLAFPQLLAELTTKRLAAKEQLKRLDPNCLEHRATDALQNSLKVLINSFYGMLGTTGLHFADPAVSNVITSRGREILLRMANNVERAGGIAIELDTDGIYFTLPVDPHTPQEIAALIGNGLPLGINVEYEGKFDSMYSYAAKNYLLWQGDKVIRKGVVFRSRRLYGLQEAFISEVVARLTDLDVPGVALSYRNFASRIRNGSLSADECTTYQNVDTTWEDYAERITKGGSRSRALDLVHERADRARFTPKSRIYYYHASSGRLKLRDDFAGDYDKGLYIDLLEKTAEKFLYLFPPDDWHRVFSEAPLHSSDAAQIRLWSFSPNTAVQADYERALKRDFQLRLF